MAQSPQHRPRGSQTPRDLLLTALPLVLVVLAFVGLAGQCSFSPGGPDTGSAQVPAVDVAAELGRVARGVDVPVRLPDVPDDWRATSVTSAGVEGGARRVVRTGWLVPTGFVQLSQSDADEAPLVAEEVGAEDVAVPTGAVDAGGATWVVYPGRREEQVWVADVDGARLLITGSAAEAEFRTLADAAIAAPVLPD